MAGERSAPSAVWARGMVSPLGKAGIWSSMGASFFGAGPPGARASRTGSSNTGIIPTRYVGQGVLPYTLPTPMELNPATRAIPAGVGWLQAFRDADEGLPPPDQAIYLKEGLLHSDLARPCEPSSENI